MASGEKGESKFGEEMVDNIINTVACGVFINYWEFGRNAIREIAKMCCFGFNKVI